MADWKVIGRGKNGWHANGLDRGNACSSSGGDLEGYAKEASNGTPVYDADLADWNTFAKLIIHGPMLDISLPPTHVTHFADKVESWKTGKKETREAFDGEEYSAMDYLGVEVWLKRLSKLVPGVKFGEVQNGQVVWK